MHRAAPALLALTLLFSCGKKEDSDILHFDNSDVYPLYNQSGATDPSWSPDDSQVTFIYQNDLWSIPPEGGEPTQLTSMGGRELYPNWSYNPSDPELVFVNTTGPNDYTIYRLKPGGEPQVVQEFTGQVTSTSWSRDGTKIIFLQTGKKGIYTIPPEGGEITQIPNDDGWEAVEIAQGSPSRDMVVYVDQKGTAPRLNEISISGGKPRVIFSFSGLQHPNSLAESYDGSTIAYITPYPMAWTNNLFFIPTSGGNPLAITDYYYEHTKNPTWSPDGKKLAIETGNGIYIVEPKLK